MYKIKKRTTHNINNQQFAFIFSDVYNIYSLLVCSKSSHRKKRERNYFLRINFNPFPYNTSEKYYYITNKN